MEKFLIALGCLGTLVTGSLLSLQPKLEHVGATDGTHYSENDFRVVREFDDINDGDTIFLSDVFYPSDNIIDDLLTYDPMFIDEEYFSFDEAIRCESMVDYPDYGSTEVCISKTSCYQYDRDGNELDYTEFFAKGCFNFEIEVYDYNQFFLKEKYTGAYLTYTQDTYPEWNIGQLMLSYDDQGLFSFYYDGSLAIDGWYVECYDFDFEEGGSSVGITFGHNFYEEESWRGRPIDEVLEIYGPYCATCLPKSIGVYRYDQYDAEEFANDFINNFEGKDEVTLKFKKGTNQTVTNFIDVFEEDSQKYVNLAGTGSYTLKENGLVLNGSILQIYLKGVQADKGYYCKLISDPGFDASSGAELYPSLLSLSSGDPAGSTSDSCKEMTVCAYRSFSQINIWPNSKSSLKDIKTCSVLTEIKIYLIESTCSFDGNTNTSKIKTKWAEMVELYNKLSSSEKALLVNSSTNEDILRMIEKYDYIYQKYGATLELNNFLGRSITSARLPIISIADESNSTWVIATVSVVSLSAVGGYFFLRKRKEI